MYKNTLLKHYNLPKILQFLNIRNYWKQTELISVGALPTASAAFNLGCRSASTVFHGNR